MQRRAEGKVRPSVVQVKRVASWSLTSLRQDPVENVGEVHLPLSDPRAQILPVQQVQEETKLTQQLLHCCNTHRRVRHDHIFFYWYKTSNGRSAGSTQRSIMNRPAVGRRSGQVQVSGFTSATRRLHTRQNPHYLEISACVMAMILETGRRSRLRLYNPHALAHRSSNQLYSYGLCHNQLLTLSMPSINTSAGFTLPP